MLSLVTICSAYVNKLGVLQFFIEQGNKQVLIFLLVNIRQSLPYYSFLPSKVVKKCVIAFSLANLA